MLLTALETATTLHEKHQIGMVEAQRMAGLPNNAPPDAVARKLLEKGLVTETVDMLFGTSPEKAQKNMDSRDLALYLGLREGKFRTILKIIIEQHQWRSERITDDWHRIRVYPGEFLIIPKDVATKLHRATY